MAMRSISKQDELTVSFGADKGNISGLKARLPMPNKNMNCLLYTSPSPRDGFTSRMPSSA